MIKAKKAKQMFGSTHLRHPVALRSTCDEWSCILWSSCSGEFSHPEWGMITALVNTARASWMIGIFSASQEDRFQRTPTKKGNYSELMLLQKRLSRFRGLVCLFVFTKKKHHNKTNPNIWQHWYNNYTFSVKKKKRLCCKWAWMIPADFCSGNTVLNKQQIRNTGNFLELSLKTEQLVMI